MPTLSKSDAGFGIYVHWPFCLHKCPYCDFNSHVRQHIDHNDWLNAYRQSIDFWKNYRSGEALTSVYFGGGTPSTAPPFVIAGILERVAKHWDISSAEITMEANPTSVEAENFAGYAQAGVNRVSIGFQAFNNDDLKRLGRMHDVNEALQALELAKKYFPRNNFDLIYARQFQTLQSWQNELEEVLKLDPSHISLYQLTIEQGTRFGDMYNVGKLRGLPDDEVAYEMYAWTRDKMRERGFSHYEVSNFAKTGEESRHNLIYWNYGDYLGIGPGAHGRVTQDGIRTATSQVYLPEKWLEAPNMFHVEQLSPIEAAEEYILMGLRVETGISFERLDELGFQLPTKNLAELIDLGLIHQSNTGIQATDEGRLVLNHIIEKLLT